jgi:hypothetical protein
VRLRKPLTLVVGGFLRFGLSEVIFAIEADEPPAWPKQLIEQLA